MIDVLTTIHNVLVEMNVPYTFNGWDCETEIPKFIGEISEIPTTDEDGKSEYSFILTGFGSSLSELFVYHERLKERFKFSENINTVVIRYNNMMIIDTGHEDLKQIQINFTVKKWSV